MKNPRLHFLGGCQEVEGACYLLDFNQEKILIDCGSRQGNKKDFYEENFSFSPSEIKAVLLTHAHLDHSGLLPFLYKKGFRGKIYATPPTKDFVERLLIDALEILKEKTEAQKEKLPYSLKEIEGVMGFFETVEYYQETKISPHLSFIFYNAGHILGSAIVLLKIKKSTKQEIRLIISGDLGNPYNLLLPEADLLTEGDYCLIESTYGDRLHEEPEKRKDLLEDTIEETIRNRGVLMIPVFALERTQEILFELNELVINQRIPQIPIFIDSPLAIELTSIYQKYLTYFRIEAFKLLGGGRNFFEFPGLIFTRTVEESKAINEVPPPKLILAGAAFSQGGRILHHEKRYLGDPRNTLLIVSYQPSGTLGRQLLEGTKKVKILGEEIEVKARIVYLSAYSAHADQKMLLNWIKPMRFCLKKAFVVQGEENAAQVLAQKIRDLYGIETEIPNFQQVVELK